jgi:hypothetical protein
MIAFLNGLGGRLSLDLEHPVPTKQNCLERWPYTKVWMTLALQQQRISTTKLFNIDLAAVRFALI